MFIENQFNKWISDKEQSNILSGGYFDHGMRWPDYIEDFQPQYREMFESLRTEIIKSQIKITGNEKQNAGNYTALFNNGIKISWTWRAWGDLMAAVWSTEEERDYSYMAFYM